MTLAVLVLALGTALPPGQVSLEFTSPATGAPLLVRHLRWAALLEPELGPDRLVRRVDAALGPGTLSRAGLEQWGVRLDRRARLHVRSGVLVAQLELADPKKARAELARLAPRLLGARASETVLVAGESPPTMVAVLIAADELWLALGESWSPPPIPPEPRAPRPLDARSAPGQAFLQGLAREKPPPVPPGPPPSVFGTWTPQGEVEGVTGAVYFLSETQLDVKAELSLSAKAQVAVGEALASKGPITPLLRVDSPVLSTRGALTRSGWRMLLERTGLPGALAASLAGPLDLAVAPSGAIAAAAALTRAPPAELLARARGALAPRFPGIELGVVTAPGAKNPVLLVTLGAGEAWPVGAVPLAERVSPARAAVDAPVVEALLAPPRVLGALTGRSRARDPFALDPLELMAFRLLAEPLLDATTQVAVRVRPHGSALSLRAELSHQ